jgi:hypothetical protein
MRTLPALVATAALACPATVSGWGFDVHRFVMDRAIDLLPASIRPFYQKHRTYLVEHSIDPDLWRNAGFTEEPPRHFIDIDAYGAYPFAALPRDYDAAVKTFGRDTIVKNGTVPWRTAEIHEQLVKAFAQQTAGGGPYTLENIKFFSAVLAHYVSDAHVPFHAVLNYDGQLTGQHGIHSRFETELFARYRGRLTLKPPARRPVTEPRDFIFEAVLEGTRLVEPILQADRRAVAGREFYDDGYFDRFLAGTQPILERRLGESIAAVAAVIAGAWEKGGRPDLPLEPRAAPRRVRQRN